jgi:hypothetical protein
LQSWRIVRDGFVVAAGRRPWRIVADALVVVTGSGPCGSSVTLWWW